MTLEDIKVGMKVTYHEEVWTVKGMEAKYTFAQVHAYLADKSLYTDVVLTRKLAGKKEESRTKAHCLSPAPEEKVRMPRYLEIAKSTPEIQDFIAYLRTPEACCLLGLEARDERVNENIRKQYRDLTGEELTEGEGYHVAPLSAGKQGCEGYVTFVVPEVVPEEISARMVQREGLINHIDFLWLLVQEGFRIKR